MAEQAGWIASDSKDNALATASKAAETGKQHIVFSVSASFSAAATKLLQIKDGTTVIWSGYVVNGKDIEFPRGVTIIRGNACSAVLASSGTGGVYGDVSIHGVTR